MTKVLITGAAGFIASHVADECLKLGYHVIGLDNMVGGYVDNLPRHENFEFIMEDVTDEDTMHILFAREQFDYVYHFAAFASEGLSHWVRRHTYLTNVVGSANLINSSVQYGVKRFVFASSAAVYGDNAGLGGVGGNIYPIDPYGVSKAATEYDLQSAWRQFRLPYSIFRLHNVYGPRQNLNDSYRNVIGIFMRQLLRGESLTVYGNGTQQRCFTYVGDAATHIAAETYPSDTASIAIDLGNNTSVSILELADKVNKLRPFSTKQDFKFGVVYLPERKEAKQVAPSHWLAETFGLECTTPLDVGLRRTLEWARNSATLHDVRRVMPIEIDKDFPEAWKDKA